MSDPDSSSEEELIELEKSIAKLEKSSAELNKTISKLKRQINHIRCAYPWFCKIRMDWCKNAEKIDINKISVTRDGHAKYWENGYNLSHFRRRVDDTNDYYCDGSFEYASKLIATMTCNKVKIHVKRPITPSNESPNKKKKTY